MRISGLVVLILLFSTSMWLDAKPNIQMTILPSDTIRIKGTSTFHDYECVSTAIKGNVEMDTLMYSFTSIDLSIPVKSIHSESSAMDDNMYEALEENKNPEIKFSLLGSETPVIMLKSNWDSTSIKGKLTIAGKTKEIDLPIKTLRRRDGTIIVRGTKNLLMSDYGITPPTFMLGLLKTGNEVTVDFIISLKGPEQSMRLNTAR